MSDVDLIKLREKFSKSVIGKLPKVTCGQCSKGSCGNHAKEKCRVCGNWVSTAHIHIDFVGHADVTDRLLSVDPEWSWAPKSTDPEPDTLRAAVASGDPEVVRMVISNAPPRFERNGSGYPVGFWMLLTVGGVTRPGYGSCPANQADAEKVLIGDALRNAAMRFGVALDLWAKGDREDPTSAPSGDGGQSDPRARKPETPRGQVSRPAARAAAAQAEDLGDWGVRIDGIGTAEECDKADEELHGLYDDGKIPAPRANAIRAAIRARRQRLAERQGQLL